MTRQIALLRGINVGGRTKVEMARLRELIGALGYDGVRTHLQSGNVVFTTPHPPEEAARKIEAQLDRHLGLTVRVLVRTREELAGVIDGNPLGDVVTDPARFLVVFLSDAPDPGRLSQIEPAAFAPELFRVGAREVYVWCPDGVGRAKLTHAFWENRLKVTATARNWNTVTKLLVLADG